MNIFIVIRLFIIVCITFTSIILSVRAGDKDPLSSPTKEAERGTLSAAITAQPTESKEAEIPPRKDRIKNILSTFVKEISAAANEGQIDQSKITAERNLGMEITLDMPAAKTINNFIEEAVKLVKDGLQKLQISNLKNQSLSQISLSQHANAKELIDSLSANSLDLFQQACASRLDYLSVRSTIDKQLSPFNIKGATDSITDIIEGEKKSALDREKWLSREKAHFLVIGQDRTTYIDSQSIHEELEKEMKKVIGIKMFADENLVLAKVELIFNDQTSDNAYLSYGGNLALFASGETSRDIYTDYSYFNGARTIDMGSASGGAKTILTPDAIVRGIADLFKLARFMLPPELNKKGALKRRDKDFEPFSKKYYHSEQFMSLFIRDPEFDFVNKTIESIIRRNQNKTPIAMILHIHSLRDICDNCSQSLMGLLEYLRAANPNLAVTLCASSHLFYTPARRSFATTQKQLANALFSTPIEIYLSRAMHNAQSPFYVQLYRKGI